MVYPSLAGFPRQAVSPSRCSPAKRSIKEAREPGLLLLSNTNNLWQHKDGSSVGKVRLLCTLEGAAMEVIGSCISLNEACEMGRVFSATLLPQQTHNMCLYLASGGGIRMADYGAERLRHGKLRRKIQSFPDCFSAE